MLDMGHLLMGKCMWRLAVAQNLREYGLRKRFDPRIFYLTGGCWSFIKIKILRVRD